MRAGACCVMLLNKTASRWWRRAVTGPPGGSRSWRDIRACRGDERELVGVTVGAGRGSGGMTGRWLEEIGAGQWGDMRSLCFMVDAGGVRFLHVLCVLSESLLDVWVGVAGGVILW